MAPLPPRAHLAVNVAAVVAPSGLLFAQRGDGGLREHLVGGNAASRSDHLHLIPISTRLRQPLRH